MERFGRKSVGGKRLGSWFGNQFCTLKSYSATTVIRSPSLKKESISNKVKLGHRHRNMAVEVDALSVLLTVMMHRSSQSVRAYIRSTIPFRPVPTK